MPVTDVETGLSKITITHILIESLKHREHEIEKLTFFTQKYNIPSRFFDRYNFRATEFIEKYVSSVVCNIVPSTCMQERYSNFLRLKIQFRVKLIRNICPNLYQHVPPESYTFCVKFQFHPVCSLVIWSSMTGMTVSKQ